MYYQIQIQIPFNEASLHVTEAKAYSKGLCQNTEPHSAQHLSHGSAQFNSLYDVGS